MSVPAAGGLAGWASRGACRDEDPDLFFPVAQAGPALEQAARAKAVCARCLVRADCLRYALGTGQDSGIWGGTTGEERRALRSRNGHAGRGAGAEPAIVIPQPAGRPAL